MEKTKEQLEYELLLRQELERHRKEDDERYAPIIVKTIVFTLVALAFISLTSWFFTSLLLHAK